MRLLLSFLAACRVEIGPPEGKLAPGPTERPEGEVWVYTSMYPSVLEAFDPVLKEALPDVQVRWYQAGSEKVAQRVEAEWAAGGSPACLLLTSDVFWYLRLEQQERLRPHLAPDVLRIDRSLVDPDGAWVTSRLSLLVLTMNPSLVPEPPSAWSDLASPQWKDRVTMGDPLSSGSAYTWLAFALRHLGGWSYVDALRANGLVAAGGNSAVLTRVATGEKPVGAILLENLLTADGTPAKPIYPSDGAVLVPGPIALTASCPNPTAAEAVYDLILSPVGQALIVEGDMYAALPELPPPDGAPPLSDVITLPWASGFAEQATAEQSATKERWAAGASP